MNNFFDDVAREIAKGTSRRDVLRALGTGLGGLLLSSLGMKSAKGAGLAPVCGTCQECDLDTNTCGLPCSPASAGTTLCTQASSDGSYLRLANYLETNGFVSAGASNSVILNKSGKLFQSVLLTNFNNPSVSGETAYIAYAVSPKGDISTLALVLQNGLASYALGVDYNGNIVQTIATHTSGSAPATSKPSVSGNIQVSGAAMPAGSQEMCDSIVSAVCGVVFAGASVCYTALQANCAAEGAGAAACVDALSILCTTTTLTACEALGDPICSCPLNQQYCNGTCCGPCMNCVNGACVASTQCGSLACCNNVCCPVGQVCNNGVCAFPAAMTCPAQICGEFFPPACNSTCCGGNDLCFCWTSAEGGGVCGGNFYCAAVECCNTSADCAQGWTCVVNTCCGGVGTCYNSSTGTYNAGWCAPPECLPLGELPGPETLGPGTSGHPTAAHR